MYSQAMREVEGEPVICQDYLFTNLPEEELESKLFG